MCVDSRNNFNTAAWSAVLPVAALLLAANAHALSSDTGQPIHISADRASLDERNGVMTYSGSVRITQGSMVIDAETVTTYAPGRRLERIVSEGRPATWRQTTDDGKEVRAEARRIEYLAADKHLTLTGSARLWQDQDRFAGERIDYDLDTETMDASSAGDKGRIEVILQPRRPAE